MTTDVNDIKEQFARFLEEKDWRALKAMAEYYLATAAKLKRKDINAPDYLTLWIRNSVKRLFIGVGSELILKSFYLKEGYCVNLPKKKRGIDVVPTHKLHTIEPENFDHNRTYTFNTLIDHLKSIHHFQSYEQIERAFRIAMVYRNKEGHVTFLSHDYVPQDYSDIENGLVLFYKEGFGKDLDFEVSMARNQRGVFKVS